MFTLATNREWVDMRLVLHSVWTSSVPNLRVWVPEDPRVFFDIVCLDIGVGAKSQGTDVFMITVATPGGLKSAPAESGVVLAGPVLVLETYDFDTMWAWLNTTVDACVADTWSNSVDRLRRWFRWEYDNFRRE